jgi:hypothetical protein
MHSWSTSYRTSLSSVLSSLVLLRVRLQCIESHKDITVIVLFQNNIFAGDMTPLYYIHYFPIITMPIPFSNWDFQDIQHPADIAANIVGPTHTHTDTEIRKYIVLSIRWWDGWSTAVIPIPFKDLRSMNDDGKKARCTADGLFSPCRIFKASPRQTCQIPDRNVRFLSCFQIICVRL